MAHTTLKSGYTELVDRLNRFPQGAPPSGTLYKILEMLFSEREAEIVAQLPVRPFTAEKAATILKLSVPETRAILEELASRAILVDVDHDGESVYILPPPMAGFFEFSMMRLRGDVDQKVRHKMLHVDRNCDAPMEICMTFNGSAESLIKHGYARSVDVAEGMDLLQQAYERNLVQFGENVRERVNFICNCCGCCCEAMIAARKFGMLNPVHTSNFLPVVEESTCIGCGMCTNVCPVEAMTLVSSNDPHDASARKAAVDEDVCLGCGVCVRTCPRKCLSLASRPQRVITPLNSLHRTIVMAIERGDLQDLIFDNRAMWNHRAMAAVLGTVLQLPPIKQAMASKQMKSRYLEYLITHVNA